MAVAGKRNGREQRQSEGEGRKTQGRRGEGEAELRQKMEPARESFRETCSRRAEKRWRAGVLSSTCQETLCAWVAVPVVVARTCLAARFTPGGTLSASAEGSALCCSRAGGGGSRDRADQTSRARSASRTRNQRAGGVCARGRAIRQHRAVRQHMGPSRRQSCATHARGAAPSRRAPAAGDAVPVPLISESLRQSSRSRFPLAGGRAEQ